MAQPQRSTEGRTAAPPLLWWRATAAVGLGIFLGAGLLALVMLFARPAALLFLAMCIACALWPVVRTLARWLPRGLAILLIYAVIVAVVALIVAILIPPIVTQLRELAERLPNILEHAREFLAVVFIVIVQQVQGNIITPHVMNDQANVPRFLVPLVILAGGAIGGILGALIAVPLTAVLRVVFLRVLAPLIRRGTGAPDAPNVKQAAPRPPRAAPGRMDGASLLLVTLAMTMGCV